MHDDSSRFWYSTGYFCVFLHVVFSVDAFMQRFFVSMCMCVCSESYACIFLFVCVCVCMWLCLV